MLKGKIKNLIAVCLVGVVALGFGIGGIGINETNAAYNDQINYQGKLTDANNIEVPNADYNIVFKLWDADTGGELQWQESWTLAKASQVPVSNGLFSVMLGSLNNEGTNLVDVDFNQDLYLGVKVGEDLEMYPRKVLGAIPLALEAAKLGGKAETAFGTLSEDEEITGAWTFSNLLTITEVPTGEGVHQGSLYINPASSTADYTLLGLAVNGLEKFRLDAEGDLTMAGGLTVGSDIVSDTADTDSLGSATKEWLNAYIGDAGKLYFGLGQDATIHRNAANEMTLTASSGVTTSADLTTTGNLTISTGQNLTIGTTQWNSADEIDGTKIKDADYGDVVIDAAGDWQVSEASDLNCTNCINATEIEDIYVLNTSDTMTGSLSVGTTLTVSSTLAANGIVTLGDGGDTVAINSSDWDISATGDMTGIGSIDQGLVAWWPLDEGAGGAISDKSGQSNDGFFNFSCGINTVTDIEGNEYNTIVVGSQCWMKENMRTTKYPDGGDIEKGPAGAGAAGWNDITTAYYSCLPTDDCPAKATLGLLYQWKAAMNGAATCNGTGESQPQCATPVQGICPDGWHIPSHYEYTKLERQICSDNSESDCTVFTYDLLGAGNWFGYSEGSDMAADVDDEGWNAGNLRNSPHFSSSGLDIPASGYRDTDGNYLNRGDDTYLWSSTESGDNAWKRTLNHTESQVYRNYNNKALGFSVRCLLD